MYYIKDNDYLKLINLYSLLTDSYKKLIKLEKINNVPITSKPVILTLIDKLYINNLTDSSQKYEESDEEEEQDLDSFKNYFVDMMGDEDDYNYNKVKGKSKKPKPIKYSLHSKYDIGTNNDINFSEQKAVIFSKKDGKIISKNKSK